MFNKQSLDCFLFFLIFEEEIKTIFTGGHNMMDMMIMNVVRILIFVLIIYAVVKGLKTLLKIAIAIFAISIILGLLGF